jgi:hypothetical protein
MSINRETSIETTDDVGCPNSGPVLGKSVDTIEPRVIMDTVIDQAQGLKKFIYSRNFLYSVAINRTVHNLSTFEIKEYSDPTWLAAPGLDGKRVDPISDFGIKVGCLVTAAEMRFHALIAILLKGMWKYILRRPLSTWRLCLWHSAPFFSIAEVERSDRPHETMHKGEQP